MSCIALRIESEALRIEFVGTPRSLVMALRRVRRHSQYSRHRIETTWTRRETTSYALRANPARALDDHVRLAAFVVPTSTRAGSASRRLRSVGGRLGSVARRPRAFPRPVGSISRRFGACPRRAVAPYSRPCTPPERINQPTACCGIARWKARPASRRKRRDTRREKAIVSSRARRTSEYQGVVITTFRKCAIVPGPSQSATAPRFPAPDFRSFTISVGCSWPFTYRRARSLRTSIRIRIHSPGRRSA